MFSGVHFEYPKVHYVHFRESHQQPFESRLSIGKGLLHQKPRSPFGSQVSVPRVHISRAPADRDPKGEPLQAKTIWSDLAATERERLKNRAAQPGARKCPLIFARQRTI